jgi:hypothetical protein
VVKRKEAPAANTEGLRARQGLVHALLGIREREELLGHPVVGASWEGMVIENVLGALPASAQTSFYRTSVGAEIDLTIESLGNPAPNKGFYIGCQDIRATRQIVIYPGTERYKLDPKTEVMSLDVLLRKELHRAK